MVDSAYGAVTREVSRYMNANNAKLLALVLVFTLAAYHAAVRWRHSADASMCEALLTDGRFAGGHSHWQPSGCMLHYYTKKDFRMCINDIAYWGGHTRIVLMGDSRMRQLFCALSAHANEDQDQIDSTSSSNVAVSCPSSVRRIRREVKPAEGNAPDVAVASSSQTHSSTAAQGKDNAAPKHTSAESSIDDLEFLSERNRLRIEFRNRQVLNRAIQKEVAQFADESAGDRPTLVVLTYGLATLLGLNGSSDPKMQESEDINLALELRQNVTTLIHSIDRLPRTRAFWMLQDPVYDGRTWANYSSLSNARIDKLNDAMSISLYANTSGQSHSSIWSSARLVAAELRLDSSVDGVHAGDHVTEWKLQQLLNAYCNARMHYADSSCCRPTDQLTATQMATLLVFGSFALLWLVLRLYLFGMRCRGKSLRDGYRPLNTNLLDGTAQSLIGLSGSQITTPTPTQTQTPSPSGTTEPSALSLSSNTAKVNNGATVANLRHKSTNLENMTSSTITVSDDEAVSASTLDIRSSQCRLAITGNCSRVEACYVVLECLARFALVVTLCFVCDRLPVFMKENKVYTPLNFLLPLAYVLAIGLFFVDDSKLTAAMNRDVTDEWKGWMQLFVLICNLSGALQDPLIYAAVRCVASAYLFLFAFGHFTVCVTRPEQCGARRLCAVLFRLNFYSISLCFAMNRAYQFYTFTALVSFWFLLLHTVLFLLPPRLSYATSPNGLANEQLGKWFYVRFGLKVSLFTGLVLMFSLSDVIFDNVFYNSPFRSLFTKTEDEFDSANALGTWKFRFQVDRFTVLAGCLFAFALQLLRRYGVLADNSHSNLFVKSRTNALVFAAGCAALAVYALITVLSPAKLDLVSRHPYIVVLPIVGYAAVRNVLGSVRRRYSPVFAWVGRHSLELYVSSYHVWLAADGNGVMVLVRSNHVLNLLLTTLVFLCVAHEVRRITCALTPRLVPADWRLLLIHLLVFIAVLVLPTALAHNVIRF